MKTLATIAAVLFALTAQAAQLTLTWKDNSDDENGFKIERSIDNETFEEIGTVSADVKTYVDLTVDLDQSYWYRVRAWNAYGHSEYTDTVDGIAVNGPPDDPDEAEVGETTKPVLQTITNPDGSITVSAVNRTP